MLTRALRADSSRRSRFHTADGTLCLDPGELIAGAWSTFARLAFGAHPQMPWLPRKAISALSSTLYGRAIFEYGTGRSTRWLAERSAMVCAVESDPAWFELVSKDLAELTNASIVLRQDKYTYVNALKECGARFDVVIIDGMHRVECLEASATQVPLPETIVCDNTDADCYFHEAVERSARTYGYRKTDYIGYAPAQFHPNRTSILTLPS